MIVAIGIDVIEVQRMQRTLERHGQHFLEHVFSPEELDAAPKTPAAAAYFAGRWAAKEAAAKALGTGIGRHCAWTDIRVLRDAAGKPVIHLRGAGARTAQSLGVDAVHATISHTGGLACACVVLERDSERSGNAMTT